MNETLDTASLSRDDLIEELKIQLERNRELKLSSEGDTQRIYELTRQLETANATQIYLMQELEQQNTTPSDNDILNAQNKLQIEYDELRKNYNSINFDYEALQQEFEKKEAENTSLKEKLEATTNETEHITRMQDIIDDYQKRIAMLENENMELLQKLEEVQANELQQTLAMGAHEKKLEVLQDRVNCLEENLNSKREEIEEKMQILDSVQEQLLEANSKIAVLTTAPQSNERKGNSLFAEVDDQRQVMKQLLAAQKKNYLQMKKAYNECEHEIRRLKRENIAMHTELQMCSKIFYSADKTYQDKLKERIQYLLNQNESLEKQLNCTQNRLKQVAGDNSVLWLESMLNFCRQETDDLKKQLYGLRIKQASLEEQLRNSQQEMARWRFESLKARCILIDRENILDENKISYNACKDNIFSITDEHVELLKKQTAHKTITSEIDSTICSESIPSINIKEEPKNMPSTPKIKKNAIAESKLWPIKLETFDAPCEDKENEININEGSNISQINDIANKIKQENTEERKQDVIPLSIDLTNSPLTTETTHRPSILTKTHSLLEKCTTKQVKFTDAPPVIYNITPMKNDDSVVSNKNTEAEICLKKSNKSNIIVRRIVIKPKQENQPTSKS